MKSNQRDTNILIHATTESYSRTESLDLSKPSDSHHLITPIQGSLRVQTDSSIWSLSTNRSILIQNKNAYQIRTEGNTSFCTLEIYPKNLPFTKAYRLFDLTPLLKEVILQIARQEKLDQNIKRDLHIFELLKDYLKVESVTAMSIPLPKEERALKIYHLIVNKKQYDQPFDILAKKVGGSTRTLERIFQNELGMTFSKWRQLLRLQQSLILLDEGVSVADAAEEIGYSSSSAFIHSFKGYFGSSPGQYLSTKKEGLS